MRYFGEPVNVKNAVVRCDGDGGPLGHPVVFLNLIPKEEIVCPYCSRYFVRENKDKIHKKRKE
ncbi:MAG: zinc-finger domain-containing protein [Alphaproteobacteria bacterium]|nr:zinc-finger domain-containing protein [Alphaproteobacteria bacterium]